MQSALVPMEFLSQHDLSHVCGVLSETHTQRCGARDTAVLDYLGGKKEHPKNEELVHKFRTNMRQPEVCYKQHRRDLGSVPADSVSGVR